MPLWTPAPRDSAQPLDWALWYAAHGWSVFPCAGKRPVTRHGFQDATTDPDQIRSWWQQWPAANIGSPLGATRWALDVDARHEGLDTLRELEATYSPLPRTVASLTGSGGGSQHLLWAVGDRPIHNKADLGAGLDVQAEGSYIIVPPSLHPDTQQPYCWEADFGPDDLELQPAPPWLEALVTQDAPSTGRPRDSPGGPIPEGQRERTLMALAGAMQRVGADLATIQSALEAANVRCVPPLDAADLARMAHSVTRYAPAPSLEVPVPNRAPVGWSSNGGGGAASSTTEAAWAIPVEQTGWYKQEVETYANRKTGIVSANNTTILAFLRNHPAWAGHLWWDDMASKMMLDDDELTDHRITDLGGRLGTYHKLAIHSDHILARCLLTICREHTRDPLQEWLGSLGGWDGVPRLATWFLDCAGVADTSYHRFCSQLLIVSMIARACDPGCICRAVLILEGPEEYRKSTFVNALVPYDAWGGEISGNLEGKEAHLLVQGLWVAELSELDSLGRTEETRLKSFISMRVDAHIPKFKSLRINPKRRTIFVGTTNESSYLKGNGNTRFWPVRIGHPMDIEGFSIIRDQLFAEALCFYNDQRSTWWLPSDEVREEAMTEREHRRQASVFESDLDDWLAVRRFREAQIREPTVIPVANETSWPELAAEYLKLDTREKWKDLGLQRQVGQALRALHWHSRVVKRHGRPVRLWLYEAPPPF